MQARNRRLPSLNSLRAFEASARHLSFTKAADELFVSPAAVSQQVRLLEDFLNVVLFNRVKGRLVLTDRGRESLPRVTEAFDELSEVILGLRSAEHKGVLTVNVAPSLATKWLIPRLNRFQHAFPDIDLRIVTTDDLVDFHKGAIDVAICYGNRHYSGLPTQMLLPIRVFPVCSPALLSDRHPIRTMADLRFHTLLHFLLADYEGCPTWKMWLQAASVSGVEWWRGPQFSHSSLMLDAAVAGQGVALAKEPLAQFDLRSGALATLSDVSLPAEFAYHLVATREGARSPKVRCFVDWIMFEAAGFDRHGADTPTLPGRAFDA